MFDSNLSVECRRVEIAQRILSVRKLREAEFSLNILGEPAFTMLLELYVLEASASPACLEALQQTTNVSVSVASRWLSVLHDEGLTTCERRQAGELKALIELTPLGRGKLERFLDSVQGYVTHAPS